MIPILTKQLFRLFTIFMAVGLLWLNTDTIYAQTMIDSPGDGSVHNADQYRLFTLPITVSGGVPPYTFEATGLPAGLEIVPNADSTAATIEGVTSSATPAVVTIDVTDVDEGNITTDQITITINITTVNPATDIVINVPDVYELTDGTVNEVYTTVVFSTTDDAIEDRYNWAISEGEIPDGMGLSSGDGSLIGIPTESGIFNFTVQVTDPDEEKEDGFRDYKLTITGGSTGGGDLEISSPTSSNLPNGVLGQFYSVDVDASGGDGGYIFTQSGLPGGLDIDDDTGVISGTPVATGTFNVDITVEDTAGEMATREYTLTVTETGEAVYGSNPNPGATIDFGNVNIGSTFTVDLIVSEEGTDQLDVTQPSGGVIQGVDAPNFSITTNSPPFSIVDGGVDLTVRIACSPDEARSYSAILQFNTNDEDQSLVVYSLFCTGVLDGGSEDTDTGTDGDGGVVVNDTPTPSIPTQTPLPPTYSNVIEVEGLSLRTGPFIGSSRVSVLRRDTNYRVTAKNNQEGVYMWYYIITDEGLEGWASGRYLAVYGQDVPFSGSSLDNVWNERDRGVVVGAIDNIHFRPGPSDRTQPYADLIPWGGRMRVYARTTSGRGDEWYAVDYNGVKGWVYAPVTKVVEGLMEAIPKY